MEKIEAVSPQALDPEAAEAVPEKVEAGALAVKAAGAGDDKIEQQQTDQIPKAFVEERRMHVHIGRTRGPQAHPPGKVSKIAEGFSIHKVAPAPDGLADEKSLHAAVRQRPERDLFTAAEDISRQKARNDAAVDGKAAVPDAVGRRPVDRTVAAAKKVEVKEHIVEPRANDGGGDDPEDGIDDVVFGQAIFRRLLHAEIKSQQHTGGDDDAIPVNAVSDIERLRGRGKLPVAEKPWEADGYVGKFHRTINLLFSVR